MGDFWIPVQSVAEAPRSFRIETTRAWWEQAQVVPAELVLRLAEPFVVTMEGYRLGRRLLFRGRIEGAVELACGACTEPFLYRHSCPLELLLEPLASGTEHPEGGIELDPEEESLGRYAGEQLNFEPAVLENLLLSWPMQQRCSESCLGLCPACGVNRNRERCSCAGQPLAEPAPDKRRPLGDLAERLARRPRGSAD